MKKFIHLNIFILKVSKLVSVTLQVIIFKILYIEALYLLQVYNVVNTNMVLLYEAKINANTNTRITINIKTAMIQKYSF